MATAYRRSPDVTFEVVDARALLVDGRGKELITLNPVGTMVWAALDGSHDARALASDLHPQFSGVTFDELERDINAFLGELAALGLIEG